jgi:uncharacterized protein YukE
MSVLKLTLVSDPTKFKSGLDKASKELKSFGSIAGKVSSGVTRALGTVGLGLGVAKLTGFLKQSAKAAAEDAVSKNQLALSLKNTLDATVATRLAAERWIQTTSNAVAVLDDDLRPALADAVRATGSLDAGQKLLNLALDISAAKGKDLGSVTSALSKAYNGQTASLKKLIPGIAIGVDFQTELTKQFQGSAKAAADLNPYQRLQVVFENIKEEIGTGLLPLVKEFSDYLKTPEGQKNLQQVVKLLQSIGKGLGQVGKFLIENIALIKALAVSMLFAKAAIGGMTLAMKLYDMATKIAKISTTALKFALVSTGIGAVVVALGTLAAAFMETSDATDNYNKSLEGILANTAKLKTESDNAWANSWVKRGEFYMNQVKDKADAIDQALKEKTDNIKKTAEKFRDSVGLAFGTAGTDEYSVFNVDKVINKLKRMVDAAKGFAANLKKLTKAGAGQDVINELVGMGPAQGNIVAQGLLQSGRLSEYLGLRGSLQMTGTQVGTVAADTGEKTYTINVNKANVTAADIIKEIRKFEKQTGKKYFVN